jgi:hypothetical protein
LRNLQGSLNEDLNIIGEIEANRGPPDLECCGEPGRQHATQVSELPAKSGHGVRCLTKEKLSKGSPLNRAFRQTKPHEQRHRLGPQL